LFPRGQAAANLFEEIEDEADLVYRSGLHFREGRGNVGIIRSPVRASFLPDKLA
jgi:hypothetical protein